MSPRKIKKGKTRLTQQRKIILEALKKACFHPTAEQIDRVIKKKLPKVSLATVYRNLDFLRRAGLIIKLKSPSKDKKARYDGNIENHLHLVCKECGKVIDVFDCTGIDIKSKELKKSGFTMECGYIEIPGLCKRCKSKSLKSLTHTPANWLA